MIFYHTNEKTAPRQCPSARVPTPGGAEQQDPTRAARLASLTPCHPHPPRAMPAAGLSVPWAQKGAPRGEEHPPALPASAVSTPGTGRRS